MSQQGNKCPVNATRQKLTFFYNDDSKDGMCSKCHPCKLGIFDAIKIFAAIQAGRGNAKDVALLERIARDVKDGGLCKKGKDHADILSKFLAEHRDDLSHHIEGVCKHLECAALVRYEIDPDRCTMCDKCREVCPSFAIEGQKKYAQAHPSPSPPAFAQAKPAEGKAGARPPYSSPPPSPLPPSAT